MVSSTDMLAAVRELSNTKQLDRAELHALLQDGIMAALAKKYGANVQAEVDIDEGKGEIRIVLLKTVVDAVEDPRKEIRDEFSTRVGELLSGEVQQIERGKLVVMLNKFREAEAIIPYREQNHREHFHQGEPIRAVLKRVEETPKGPRLILSRGDPMFV